MREITVTIYSETPDLIIERHVYIGDVEIEPVVRTKRLNANEVSCPFCTTVQGVRRCPLCKGHGKMVAGYPSCWVIDGIFRVPDNASITIKEVWISNGRVIKTK